MTGPSATETRAHFSGGNGITYTASTGEIKQTARTISGISYDGSANITLNTSGITENTNLYYTDARVRAAVSGGNGITFTAGTGVIDQTARTINTVSYNGTANIVVEPFVERDDASNATRRLTFVDDATAGHKRLNMDTALTFNPATGTLTSTNYEGTVNGGTFP